MLAVEVVRCGGMLRLLLVLPLLLEAFGEVLESPTLFAILSA